MSVPVLLNLLNELRKSYKMRGLSRYLFFSIFEWPFYTGFTVHYMK